MIKLVAVAALALGVVTSTPARADFAVVQFQDGWCKIWWDSASTPWGVGWTKIATGRCTRLRSFAGHLSVARIGVGLLRKIVR
jgi:hypothetical protein